MEKKGRVRNIIVTGYDDFVEYLIKDLTKIGINYVQIGNEFHFLDRIYRFYDTKLHRDIILSQDKFIEENCIVCNPLDMALLKERDAFESFFKKFEDGFFVEVVNDCPFENDQVYEPLNKRNIKKNNYSINKILKKKINLNKPVNNRRGK